MTTAPTPTNNFTAVVDLIRSAVQRGTKNLPTARTIDGVTQFQCVEQTLAPTTSGTQILQGPATPAVAVVVFAIAPLVLHLNGSGAPGVGCGSISLLMD